jgi:hypothetical protein
MYEIMAQSGVSKRLDDNDFLNGQVKFKSKQDAENSKTFFNLGKMAASIQRDKVDNANAMQQVNMQRAMLDVEKGKVMDMTNALSNKQAEIDGKLNVVQQSQQAAMYPSLPQVAGLSPFPELPVVNGASPYPQLPIQGAMPQGNPQQDASNMPPPIYG